MDPGSIGLKVLEILSPVLLAALTWAAAKLAQLIRAKAQNEYLKGVLVRLDDAVFTAVKDLQQTVVSAIKEASADGRITDRRQAVGRAARREGLLEPAAAAVGGAEARARSGQADRRGDRDRPRVGRRSAFVSCRGVPRAARRPGRGRAS